MLQPRGQSSSTSGSIGSKTGRPGMPGIPPQKISNGHCRCKRHPFEQLCIYGWPLDPPFVGFLRFFWRHVLGVMGVIALLRINEFALVLRLSCDRDDVGLLSGHKLNSLFQRLRIRRTKPSLRVASPHYINSRAIEAID